MIYYDSPAVAALRVRLEAGSHDFRGYWHSQIRQQRLKEAREKGTHTPEQWEGVLMHFGWRCVRCGASGVALQKDHIKPIYQGGSDGLDNLQPLCVPCNAGKGRERISWAIYRNEYGFSSPQQKGMT